MISMFCRVWLALVSDDGDKSEREWPLAEPYYEISPCCQGVLLVRLDTVPLVLLALDLLGPARFATKSSLGLSCCTLMVPRRVC